MRLTKEEKEALEDLGQNLGLGANTIDILIKLIERLIKSEQSL